MSASQPNSYQSIQVCALRATRLSAAGVPLSGATSGYIAKAPIMVKLTPDNKTGVELMVETGCGTLGGYYQAPDQLKKYNIAFDLTDLDHELIELLTDEAVVTVGGLTVGHVAKRVGACSEVDRNGVAIEFWSKKWDSCSPPSGDKYWHWFMPRAFLQTGEYTLQNDFVHIPITGYLQENPAFIHGSWTSAAWPTAAGSLVNLFGVITETSLPTAASGYQTPS